MLSERAESPLLVVTLCVSGVSLYRIYIYHIGLYIIGLYIHVQLYMYRPYWVCSMRAEQTNCFDAGWNCCQWRRERTNDFSSQEIRFRGKYTSMLRVVSLKRREIEGRSEEVRSAGLRGMREEEMNRKGIPIKSMLHTLMERNSTMLN